MRSIRTGHRSRRPAQTHKLRMTSMMDILVVLLLFLLKSFVVDGEAMTPPPGVQLPESSSETHPENSVRLAVNDRGILLGDELVATMDAVRAQEDMLIPGLAERLVKVREQMDKLSAKKGRTAENRTVTIQGDRDLEFAVLQKIMYTLSQEGFAEISLAVIKKS